MAGEAIYKYGTQKTLEANGGSITNGTVVQANDATYSVVADGAYYPDAEFVASFTYGTGPTEGTALVLLARPINIDSTNDAEVPEAGLPQVFVGSFVVNNVTTLQYQLCVGYNLPREAEYYLYNASTGQTVSAGWTLKVTPRTYAPAA